MMTKRFKPLTKFEARNVAGGWHGGQWSPLYSFASTGMIRNKDDILSEIDSTLRETLRAKRTIKPEYSWLSYYDTDAVNQLRALRKYVRRYARHY